MNEELKKIFEGQEVSEEFLAKLEEMLQAKLDSDKEAIKEAAKAEAQEALDESNKEYQDYLVAEMEEKLQQYIEEELVTTIETYISESVKEFATENKLQVESQVKVDLADKFLKGVSEISESYNVEVPSGQDDVVSKLEKRIEESNNRVNTLIEEKKALETKLNEGVRKDSMAKVFEGLTETQKEKLEKASARIKFSNEEQFESALSELKESYFPPKDEDDKEDDKTNLNEDKQSGSSNQNLSYADRLAASL